MKKRPRTKSVPRIREARLERPAAYPPTWAVLLGIAVVVWVFRYWRFMEFGLYEDDIVRIPAAMEAEFGGIVDHIRGQFMMNGQGRPLHDGTILLCSWIAARLGGLATLYIFGYAVVALNGWLSYLLLRRVDLNPQFAVLGTLIWVLYPVDTVSQLYLTLSLSAQVSLTLFLLASLAYLSGRRKLAYALIGLTLFCYETIYPVFLVVPMLVSSWDRRLLKTLGVHAGVLMTMMAGAVMLRTVTNATVTEMPSLAELVTWPWRQMAVGVYTALTTLAVRSISQLSGGSAGQWVILAPFSVALLFAISEVQSGSAALREGLRRHGKVALAGFLMLAFSYGLAFTVDAAAHHGRATRVHTPGVAGAALIGGSALSLLISYARRRRGRLAAEAAIAILFTGMAGYAREIQDDYAVNWARQRAFWSDVIHLCPDAANGDVILLDREKIRETREIELMGWAVTEYVPLMFEMPREWQLPPVAAYLKWGWRQGVANGRPVSAYVDWGWREERYRGYEEEGFIILAIVDGELDRYTEPFEVGGEIVVPKPVGEPQLTRLPRRMLYSLLALRPGESAAEYTE